MASKSKNHLGLMTGSVLLLALNLSAQHVHNGFYLYTGMGPAFGNIQARSNQGEKLDISGTAYSLDFQIGGTIRKNLALHATIGLKSIFGPTINGVKLNDDYQLDEFIFGGGLTYYNDRNYFISGSLGAGTFSFVQGNTTNETDPGLSFQLNAGREWWISPRWALGVSGQYAGTKLTSRYGNGEKENWNSQRFSIMLRATLHGKNN